jgi:hypothetical protein
MISLLPRRWVRGLFAGALDEERARVALARSGLDGAALFTKADRTLAGIIDSMPAVPQRDQLIEFRQGLALLAEIYRNLAAAVAETAE